MIIGEEEDKVVSRKEEEGVEEEEVERERRSHEICDDFAVDHADLQLPHRS